MNFYGSSEEHDPVTWVRGYGIYAAHLVVLVFVASLLIGGILMFANVGYLLNWLVFRSDAVLRGEFWRIFTYGLVNPPSQGRVLWFAIDMLMLVWFGREVEKFFGRRKFLLLYGCVYLLLPLIFTVLGRWLPASLAGESGAFAIFIAFATLYPNVAILFSLLAKWIAFILVAIYTVAALAEHDWVSLISLWAGSGFAYGFVRHEQGRFRLPRFKIRLPRRPRKTRMARVKPLRQSAGPSIPKTVTSEVDALLDKIAQSGFGSLTPQERAKLEAAREELRRRANE